MDTDYSALLMEYPRNHQQRPAISDLSYQQAEGDMAFR